MDAPVIAFIGRFERHAVRETVRAHYRHPNGGVRMTEWCDTETEVRQPIPAACRVDAQNHFLGQG